MLLPTGTPHGPMKSQHILFTQNGHGWYRFPDKVLLPIATPHGPMKSRHISPAQVGLHGWCRFPYNSTPRTGWACNRPRLQNQNNFVSARSFHLTQRGVRLASEPLEQLVLPGRSVRWPPIPAFVRVLFWGPPGTPTSFIRQEGQNKKRPFTSRRLEGGGRTERSSSRAPTVASSLLQAKYNIVQDSKIVLFPRDATKHVSTIYAFVHFGVPTPRTGW